MVGELYTNQIDLSDQFAFRNSLIRILKKPIKKEALKSQIRKKWANEKKGMVDPLFYDILNEVFTEQGAVGSGDIGKLEFRIDNTICLDHRSVIQNFLPNSIWISSKGPEDIDHKFRHSERARGLIKDRNKLEDYADIENVIKAFRNWREMYRTNPKLLHAHGERENTFTGEIENLQCSWIAQNRFDSNRNIYELSKALNFYKGPGVFLTLTVEHSRSMKEAWQGISQRWNIFLTRLAKELGISRRDLKYIWVLEAQANGYPHIHALFLGIDWLYDIGNKEAWANDGPHSKNLKHYWKWGGVYINATRKGETIQSPVAYLMKYIRKTFSQGDEPEYDLMKIGTLDTSKRELTQALLWAFRKRSFNTNRGLIEWIKLDLHIESEKWENWDFDLADPLDENSELEPELEIPFMAQSVDVTDWHLVEMAKLEILHGQKTPLVRLITIPKGKPYIEAPGMEPEILTVDDLESLYQVVADYNGVGVDQEVKAIRFLEAMQKSGRTGTYILYPKELKRQEPSIIDVFKKLRNGKPVSESELKAFKKF